MDELRRQLADAPAEVVVANHCYGLFELAALYLSQDPPLLDQAPLAIDALGCLVEGLGARLGETQGPLTEALAQVRLAYVLVAAAEKARQEAPGDANGSATAVPRP
jgi:lysozyme family protein